MRNCLFALGGRRSQDMLDLRQRRRLFGEVGQEAIQGGRFPFNLDQDATGLVPDKAGQPAAHREPEHKRPESDPLDDAANHDGPTFHDVDPVTEAEPAWMSAERFCTSDPAIVTAACSRDQRVTQRQVGCRVVIGRSNLKGLAQRIRLRGDATRASTQVPGQGPDRTTEVFKLPHAFRTKIMKSSSMAHCALLVVWGLLHGCAPTSSQPSESPIDGKLQRVSTPSALELEQQAPTGRQGQSTSRSSSRPKPDGSATARVDAASSQDTSYLDAEWTMNIQPDATVLIQHKGAPVLRAQHVTWAEKTKQTPDGKWVMSKFKAERVAGGQNILSGRRQGPQPSGQRHNPAHCQ